MNKIVEQIERLYEANEQTVKSAIAWDDDEKCEVSLLLSNKCLYVYNNVAFNNEVRYILLSNIRNIQLHNERYRINLKTNGHQTLFPSKDDSSNLKKLIDILMVHNIPLIDLDMAKKKIVSIIIKITILLIIIITSSLSVIGYKHFEKIISSPSADERRMQKEDVKKKKEAYTKKATQQIGFYKNFLIRLNVYRDYLVNINDILDKIDISDKDFDWNSLTLTMNDKTSEFMQLKIQSDDMVDYGIHINKKKNFLRDDTSKINSDIESLINKIQQNTLKRFDDITSLISLKNQCAEIIKHIDNLIKDINNETNLIEQSVSDD